MRFYYLNTLYSILVGFGFAFTVRAFQSGIRDFFSSLRIAETEFNELIRKVTGRKVDLEGMKFSFTTNEKTVTSEATVDDLLNRISTLEKKFDELYARYSKQKEVKEFTNNFSTLSLLSAAFALWMLFIATTQRISSIHFYGLYESILYFDFIWVIAILILFVRDCKTKYNNKPVNKRYFIPVILFFFALLIFHAVFNDKSWIDNDNSKIWVAYSTVFVPAFHYALYAFRTLILIPITEKDYKNRIETQLNPIINGIEADRNKLETIAEFMDPILVESNGAIQEPCKAEIWKFSKMLAHPEIKDEFYSYSIFALKKELFCPKTIVHSYGYLKNEKFIEEVNGGEQVRFTDLGKQFMKILQKKFE